ncbi:MAG: hypothetical protein Q8Q39_03580 [bacterium]|nr:hypothetical protein [bacterium]
MKKIFKFIAKYFFVGILPSAILSVVVKKLEGAHKNPAEHADEVLLNAALTAIVAILTLGATLVLVRWLVVSRGVESGLLVLIVAWLAGIAIMSFVVLPSYWSWKKYGFHYGILMAVATVLGMLVLGAILVIMLIFFGFGLKLLVS